MLFALAHAAEPSIKIWTVEEPPTNYNDEKGRLTGLAVDVVREMQKVLKDVTPIEIIPTARVIEVSKREPNILAFSLARNKAREDLGYQWIMQTSYKPWTFYVPKDSPNTANSLDDVKKLKIGVVRGSVFENYLTDNKFVLVDPTTAHSNNILKLLAGRVDAVLATGLIVASECKIMGTCKISAFKNLYEPTGSNSWITFSPGTDPGIVAKWKAAGEELRKNGTYKAIATKWQKQIDAEYEMKTYFNKDGILVLDSQD